MTLETPAQPTQPRVATGPKGLPFIGNMLDMGRDTFGFLEKCAAEHGDVTKIQLAQFPALLLNDSDLIGEVLLKKHQDYTKNKVFWRQLKALMGDGLFTAEGTVWQRQRKLTAPAFATKPMQGYAPDMAELAEEVMQPWQDGEVMDLYKGCMDLALRVSIRTLLSSDIEHDLEGMDHATSQINDEIVARFTRPIFIPDAVPLPGHIRYRRGIEFIEKIVYDIIEEYRSGKGKPDSFISMLMAARDENGQAMSDKQLRDEVMTMLISGYETTALNIAWAFHLLGQHRDIQDAMAAEVRENVGDKSITHEDLPNLPLVERAVIEILRLYPPAWAVGREAAVDTTIGDYDVPKGTTILLSPWLTHRKPEYFKDPLTFNPDRWKGDFRKKLPRFAYFPFGGGPRICIGSRFAMMEVMLMLGTIVRKFDIERLMDRPVTPVASVTLRPTGGIWVKLRERAA